MSNFLQNIFEHLQRSQGRVVLREVRGEQFVSKTGAELRALVERARSWLRSTGVKPGERCGLIAANSIHWIAVDLALMAEGVVVVPLYHRQTAGELAAMLKDCQPRLILTGHAELNNALAKAWPDLPPRAMLSEIFSAAESTPALSPTRERLDDELLTIIYTSGTSGEPKGVCLTVGNLNHMTGCTTERLDQLMGTLSGKTTDPDRIFLYAPMNFAASWMLMLSAFSRESVLTLSTDLTKLADEIRLSEPHYFLNVPTLLERVKRGVEENIAKQAAPIRHLYTRAKEAWQHHNAGRRRAFNRFWLGLGNLLIFGKIRARFGSHLMALICGSAPLAPETQQFFLMLGIPVLQGYG